MDSLTGRTGLAARWRFAAAIVVGLLQFLVGVLLARLLAPSDFGLVALAALMLGLVKPLSDLGICAAVVQKAHLTDRQIHAAFTSSTLLGLAATAAIVACAPLAAVATGDPQITPIVRALAVLASVRGLGAVAEALLVRALAFKQLFFIEVSAFVVGYGAVGVGLALAGHGAWSLVWAMITQTTVASTVLFATLRGSIRWQLRWREVRDLLPFGVGASLSGWANYLALNADTFIVGRWLGLASVGLYDRAYALMNLPFTYMSGAFSTVLFPAFAKVQQQPERLGRGFLLATRLTALVAAPSLTTLAVASPHVVEALYGERWRGVVAPLQILCFAGYFRALYHLNGAVARSVGRVYSELVVQVGYAILVIGGSVAAAPHGLSWVAGAVTGAILYMFVATAQVVLWTTGISWRQYAHVQVRGAAAGLATGVAALMARAFLAASGASDLVLALGIVGAAAVPWSVCVLLDLRTPEFKRAAVLLPLWPRRLVTGTK
jgi:PST family polysaccharide transporter